MKIIITSVFVNDQQRALEFYTEKLGFIKKHDIPLGKFRWLTLVSSEGNKDVELLLEPNDNPAAKTYQEALRSQGIPAASFGVTDIEEECIRLKDLSVKFLMKPTVSGKVKIAMLDDTVGNLIQIVQPV